MNLDPNSNISDPTPLLVSGMDQYPIPNIQYPIPLPVYQGGLVTKAYPIIVQAKMQDSTTKAVATMAIIATLLSESFEVYMSDWVASGVCSLITILLQMKKLIWMIIKLFWLIYVSAANIITRVQGRKH